MNRKYFSFYFLQKRLLLFSILCFFINSEISSIHAQNNVLVFDGADDYVNLDALTPALVGSQSYTIELTMRADRFAQTLLRPILFSINKSATFNIAAQNILLITFGNSTITDGLLSMSTVASGAGVNSGINIGDNICHHIAYVNPGIGSNSGLLYVDGVLVLSNLATPPVLTATDRISLGQEFDGATSSQFYKGELENVRAWTSVRTQAEIQANMNNQLTGTEPNLVALYNFNQGISGGNNTANTSLLDLNTPSNNGVLLNFNLNNSTSNFVLSSCITCVNVYSTENLSLCESNIVTFPDGTSLVVTSDTSHISNLITANGCDSLVTTNVLMLMNTYSLMQDSICSGSSYTFPDGTIHVNIIADEVYVSTIMNNEGCDSSITTVLNLFPLVPVLENIIICYGSDYTFPDGTTHTNITVDENHPSTLTNTLGCDSIVISFIIVQPQILRIENVVLCPGSDYTFEDGISHTNIVINETYTSSLISSAGCDSLIQTNITIPTIAVVNNSVDLCHNASYTFPDGTTHTNITSPENYTSTIVSSLGCDSIINTSLVILDPPQIDLGPDIEKCEGENIIVSATDQSYTYIWSTGETTNAISAIVPGLYSVMASNSCGNAVSSVQISETDCNCILFIPNSFTPNSDEFNQTYGAKFDCEIDKYKIEIYNRWGEVIYISEDISSQWDGTYSGKIVPDGLYVYKVTYTRNKDINKVITGHVNLLR